MNLFTSHEKKYFGDRNSKNLSPSNDGGTFKIGSCYWHETRANEQYFWENQKAAFDRAKQYLVTPTMVKIKDRYRLEWA